MDNTELLEKIYERFDKLNDKLDIETAARNASTISMTNRITKVETKQAGQIKLTWLLITTVFGGIISWITSQFK